jgi:hypothetical protein
LAVHPAALPDDVLLRECTVTRTRGGGPGGRHRNSTDSRVVLRHTPTGVETHADERRSQHRNLDVAVARLRLALAAAVRAPRDPAAPPSALWTSRVRAARIVCSESHRDFASLLAEALDVCAAHAWDVRPAAASLGVTPTQLVRFVASHGPALAALNRGRAAQGLPPLRG